MYLGLQLNVIPLPTHLSQSRILDFRRHFRPLSPPFSTTLAAIFDHSRRHLRPLSPPFATTFAAIFDHSRRHFRPLSPPFSTTLAAIFDHSRHHFRPLSPPALDFFRRKCVSWGQHFSTATPFHDDRHGASSHSFQIRHVTTQPRSILRGHLEFTGF